MLTPQPLKKGDKVAVICLSSGVIGEPYCAHEKELGEKKLRENSFDLNDYIEQIDMVKKMGGAGGILGMLPGMGKLKIKESDIDEKALYRTKAIIQSMTEKERKNPSILNYSRKMRIAKGSGTSLQEINKLLKGFEQSKQMMKQMKNGKKMPFKF